MQTYFMKNSAKVPGSKINAIHFFRSCCSVVESISVLLKILPVHICQIAFQDIFGRELTLVYFLFKIADNY